MTMIVVKNPSSVSLRLRVVLCVVALASVTVTNAFTVTPSSTSSFGLHRSVRVNTAVWGSKSSSGINGASDSSKGTESTTMPTPASSSKNNHKKKKLGLITFDLDDTLYPIAPVIEEANRAFARSMESFGYGDNIRPQDIVDIGAQIREEIAATDPVTAAVLTHTEIRRLAIRREMERITLARKLKACADDWATPVSSLSPIVVQHAKKYVIVYCDDDDVL
jgi:hypothetical protein